MKAFSLHVKKHVIRGFLAIIPLMLSLLVIRLLYVNIDQRIVRLVDQAIGFSFPGLGIILSLIALYVLGMVASNIMGKKTVEVNPEESTVRFNPQKVQESLNEAVATALGQIVDAAISSSK